MTAMTTQKLKLLTLLLALGSTTFHAMGAQAQSNDQVLRASTRQALPLRVVDKRQFCERLSQMFASYGTNNGYDKIQTALLASGGSARLVDEFKTGRASDYIRVAALTRLSNEANKSAEESYLSVSGFIGPAMGISNPIALALSAGELRFIPFAQKNTELVVIANNTAPLTPDRAKKIAEIAAKLEVKINVIWVGANDEDGAAIAEARPLAWLAAMTDGAFANLGGVENPCASVM